MNDFSSSLNRNLDVTREADVSQRKADRTACGQLGWYHGNLPPVPFVDGRFLFVFMSLLWANALIMTEKNIGGMYAR